jgi:hypothetical protein
MKISSDWVAYYIRSFNLYSSKTNRPIGQAVKNVLVEMGCTPTTSVPQVKSPLLRAMQKEFGESEYAKIGRVYDINIDRLPEFFKKVGDALGIEIN